MLNISFALSLDSIGCSTFPVHTYILTPENILIKTWNNLALDVNKVKCDAYDFEKGDLVAINSFRGEYMANYSWAEFTTGHYTMLRERMNGV